MRSPSVGLASLHFELDGRLAVDWRPEIRRATQDCRSNAPFGSTDEASFAGFPSGIVGLVTLQRIVGGNWGGHIWAEGEADTRMVFRGSQSSSYPR